MNPAFLLGIAFNIAYWHKKYHSGTICKDYKPKRKDSLNIRLYKMPRGLLDEDILIFRWNCYLTDSLNKTIAYWYNKS